MKWIEIGVAVRPEDVEAVSGIFEEIGTGGVVIEDPALIYDVVAKGSIETVALDPPEDPGSPPVVKGYLPADHRFDEKLGQFRGALAAVDPGYPGRISLREIEESSWIDRWRDFYQPVRVGRRILVKPSWVPASREEGLVVIEMDPGLAFGCGTHPTTAMCMALLEDVIKGSETVLDVGAGSGILSIAAAKLGAAAVVAVDSDPVAVRVARENVAANGLEDTVRVVEGNLLDGINRPADVIVANIVADVIIRLLPDAVTRLKSCGRFIASGVIADRREEVAEALASSGLMVKMTLNEGEWAAFLAVKPKHQGQNPYPENASGAGITGQETGDRRQEGESRNDGIFIPPWYRVAAC